MDVSATPTEVWSGVDGKSSDRVGGTLGKDGDADECLKISAEELLPLLSTWWCEVVQLIHLCGRVHPDVLVAGDGGRTRTAPGISRGLMGCPWLLLSSPPLLSSADDLSFCPSSASSTCKGEN